MPEAKPERPAPPRRELKIKRPDRQPVPPASPTQVPLERGPSPQGGSSFLRKLLGVILVAWLLCLAFMLLDPLPFLFPDEEHAGNWWRVAKAAPPAQAAAHDTVAQEHPELAPLKQKIAAAIVNNDLDSAMKVVLQQQQAPEIYPYTEELAALAGMLKALRRVNLTVADIVREHIDEEVTIRVKDRAVKIIPRASAGERVNALVVPADTNRPQRSATFKVTDLDPVERARWIGEADTPLKCLMKLYLHLEAGDRDSARAFAPSCGILAEALEAQFRSPRS